MFAFQIEFVDLVAVYKEIIVFCKHLELCVIHVRIRASLVWPSLIQYDDN